jgi:4-hydroxy-tetrahydrodipicolinate synthase
MKAMLPLMSTLERGGKFVQGVKFGARLAGLPAGVPRQPLRSLTKEEKRELERVIRTLKTSVRGALDAGSAHA